VDDFCYLGSWLSINGNCDKDCQTRICKASSVFGRLQDVWRNKHISLKVKVRLHESLAMSTMLYSAELCMASDHTTKEKAGCRPPQVSTTTPGYYVERQSARHQKSDETTKNGPHH